MTACDADVTTGSPQRPDWRRSRAASSPSRAVGARPPGSIRCPACRTTEHAVVDSRGLHRQVVKRRRKCLRCDTRFTTYESLMNLNELDATCRRLRVIATELQALLAQINRAFPGVGAMERSR